MGTLTVVTEEIGDSSSELFLTLGGSGLDKKDLFGKSDPYFLISKFREDGSVVLIHKR